MELFEHTFFINLNHRTDRLEHVTQEFNKMGITAERIEGIQPKSPAVGCTLSHIKCLELAKTRDYEEVFICEDDITFTNPELFGFNFPNCELAILLTNSFWEKSKPLKS